MDVLTVKPINRLGKKPKRILKSLLQKLKLLLHLMEKRMDFQQ
jgi:hypothetical protein